MVDDLGESIDLENVNPQQMNANTKRASDEDILRDSDTVVPFRSGEDGREKKDSNQSSGAILQETQDPEEDRQEDKLSIESELEKIGTTGMIQEKEPD